MKPPKRPRDPNQLAKMIVDLSTGQAEEPSANVEVTKQQLGGRQRSINLQPKRRIEIARKGADARWAKKEENHS